MIGSHISLFAGVGMTDIAAEAAGFKTIATAEIDPWCRKVLRKRFPAASHLHDVREVTRSWFAMSHGTMRRPLLISGGFPCQDVSAIGGGSGLAGARSGLWAEFARVIGEFEPEYVLIENSPMLRTRGLDTILDDLTRMGYHARWDIIPAAAVGAPHLRERMFIVAYLWEGKPCPWIDLSEEWLRDDDPLPRAGMAVGPFRWSLTPQYPRKAFRANVLYPTPRRAPNEWRTTRNAPTHGNGHGKTLAGELNDLERASGRIPGASSDNAGNVDPTFVEWMMGVPLGWTDLRDDAPSRMRWDDQKVSRLQRTVSDAYDRRHRLQALGNGLVPQCATLALQMIPDLQGAIR